MWPPSAAVRQRVMARSTLSCWKLSHGLCSMKESPCAWSISATSTAGRLIRFTQLSRERGDGSAGVGTAICSSGLAVACRCRRDRCR